MTKRVRDFFELREEKMSVSLEVNDLRTWAEAKVTGGGVMIDELNKDFECKKVP